MCSSNLELITSYKYLAKNSSHVLCERMLCKNVIGYGLMLNIFEESGAGHVQEDHEVVMDVESISGCQQCRGRGLH